MAHAADVAMKIVWKGKYLPKCCAIKADKIGDKVFSDDKAGGGEACIPSRVINHCRGVPNPAPPIPGSALRSACLKYHFLN